MFPERFPYIPHICYKNQVPLCQTIAEDCEEYLRLDTCCCQPYLRPQCKPHINFLHKNYSRTSIPGQYHSWTKSRTSTTNPSIAITTNLIVLIILSEFRYRWLWEDLALGPQVRRLAVTIIAKQVWGAQFVVPDCNEHHVPPTVAYDTFSNCCGTDWASD